VVVVTVVVAPAVVVVMVGRERGGRGRQDRGDQGEGDGLLHGCLLIFRTIEPDRRKAAAKRWLQRSSPFVIMSSRFNEQGCDFPASLGVFRGAKWLDGST
jgi:hypothetical protein